MLVDLDILLVAEFCQVQGPTLINSLPDFPCISGYTFRETERILSSLLLKTMSMSWPATTVQKELPGMYNDDFYTYTSYPLVTLIDKTDPSLFPDRQTTEQRVLYLLQLSTFLPDISARGYVRKLSLLYLSFDAKKLDYMRFNIVFGLREALAVVKYAATLTSKIDLARYVLGLNQSIANILRLEDAIQRIGGELMAEDGEPEGQEAISAFKAKMTLRLHEEHEEHKNQDNKTHSSIPSTGFSPAFIDTMLSYVRDDVLHIPLSNVFTGIVTVLEEYRAEAISRFTLLRAETLPSVVVTAMTAALEQYFAIPYAQLFNQREVAKLMAEILVISDSLTQEDVDAVYSPLLAQSITSILEHTPHVVLCNCHDLCVTVKQPLRPLDGYILPLFLSLFKETLEKLYGFYRCSLMDIICTEQCQNSSVILAFGNTFMFPASEIKETLVLTSDNLLKRPTILMDNFPLESDTKHSFPSLNGPRRFFYMPGKQKDEYDTLMTTKWLFFYMYNNNGDDDNNSNSNNASGSDIFTWKRLSVVPEATALRLSELRRPCTHIAAHYNHEAKVGHLLYCLYELLKPRIFNNIITAILQGKVLFLFSSSLAAAQIIVSALSVFSTEILVQQDATGREAEGAYSPYLHRERKSTDRLKVTVEFFHKRADLEHYCMSLHSTRRVGHSTIVVFCTDRAAANTETRASSLFTTKTVTQHRLHKPHRQQFTSSDGPTTGVPEGISGAVRPPESGDDRGDAEDDKDLGINDLGPIIAHSHLDSTGIEHVPVRVSKVTHSTRAAASIALSGTRGTTAGPSQSIFADESGLGETEASEYQCCEGEGLLKMVFTSMFIDKDHDLYLAVNSGGEAKGLLLLDKEIRYWPVEKMNCTIVRAITSYFPGIGNRSAASKLGLSNDFISRRLHNALSKFFTSFLSGQNQAKHQSGHYSHADRGNESMLSQYHDVTRSPSPTLSRRGSDCAKKRLLQRLTEGDSRILPRFRACFMEINGADSFDVEAVWLSARGSGSDSNALFGDSSMFGSVGDMQVIPTLSVNSGKTRLLDEKTILVSILSIDSVMKDTGVNVVTRT